MEIGLLELVAAALFAGAAHHACARYGQARDPVLGPEVMDHVRSMMLHQANRICHEYHQA